MTQGGQTLKESARRRSEQAEQAVVRALVEARKTDGPITLTGLATKAGVSTDFIYRHRELRAQVEALRRSRGRSPAHVAARHDIEFSESTLIRRLSHQLAELRRRHREEITELRRALAAAHGELLYLRQKLDDTPSGVGSITR
jgi:surfactin synthase thioesterase subunit